MFQRNLGIFQEDLSLTLHKDLMIHDILGRFKGPFQEFLKISQGFKGYLQQFYDSGKFLNFSWRFQENVQRLIVWGIFQKDLSNVSQR